MARTLMGLEERMDWLETVAEALSERQIAIDEVLATIVDETTREVQADRGTLYLIDHARQELVSRVAHLPEIAEIRLHLGEGVAGQVAATGKPLRIHNNQRTDAARRIDAQTGYLTESLLAVPIQGADGTIGVLQVLNARQGSFTAASEALLSTIAQRLGAALARSSLGSQLHPDSPRPLEFRLNHVIGASATMASVYERTLKAASSEATVMVRGETGTGKELIARALHHNSPRKDGPFVVLDCAAVPDNLLENELFGHERGAFTGADRQAQGRIAVAQGGTLFLDEIGELSNASQSRLLRLLQERTYTRLGGTTRHRADVRFVCATHRDLERDVREGRFREDLYYRLRVVEITLPPLRDRGHGDLERLIDHFLHLHARRHHRQVPNLTKEARALLHAHHWPGNVRELEHCLESAVVLTEGAITADDLTLNAQPGHNPLAFQSELAPLAQVEADYVRWALDQCDGNRSETARVLEIGRNTLARKLKKD